MNLVSADSLKDVWRRHILDSAQLFFLAPEKARRWVDLGSGAGLPGLITAILGASDVHLIESDERKCVFIAEAARLTRTKVTVHRARIEDTEPLGADVVTARALAPLDILLQYAARHGSPGHTCLLPKGHNVGIELTKTAKTWRIGYRCYPSRSDPAGRVLVIRTMTQRKVQ